MEAGKRKVSSLELKQLARLYKRPVTYFLAEDDEEQLEGLADDALRPLFRTTRELSEQDREQVLRFAQFLRHAGRAPTSTEHS